ncbi:hypothetical protein NPIL_266961 [Nephila pilipes]|uniref:Uncharacterized protein n=1 Tax=Nephila pilipes TaxID=299642 RepID=A0A8X6U7L5_NEPPI|nr:hypothetical protein NPIL_266961 [Nephila pilipes]
MKQLCDLVPFQLIYPFYSKDNRGLCLSNNYQILTQSNRSYGLFTLIKAHIASTFDYGVFASKEKQTFSRKLSPRQKNLNYRKSRGSNTHPNWALEKNDKS